MIQPVEASPIQLSHEEVSWEYYSGHVFPTLELVPVVDRHHGTNLQIRAIGFQFNWTLNQEVVFSSALNGKPKKKLYCLAILLEEVRDRNKDLIGQQR